MAGSLTSNIIEEFPIEIGSPLLATTNGNRLCENLAVTGFDISRKVSMASLAPSLPDYNAAVTSCDAKERSDDCDGSSGKIKYLFCIRV
jgi:hypothetical protein